MMNYSILQSTVAYSSQYSCMFYVWLWRLIWAHCIVNPHAGQGVWSRHITPHSGAHCRSPMAASQALLSTHCLNKPFWKNQSVVHVVGWTIFIHFPLDIIVSDAICSTCETAPGITRSQLHMRLAKTSNGPKLGQSQMWHPFNCGNDTELRLN